MDFIEHACFVSYAHGDEIIMKSFLKQFIQVLNGHLAQCIDEKIYIDEDRLKPGYNFNLALAQAMCKSVCMIVLFNPRYERRSYCLREFLAMEILENERIQLLGNNHDITKRMIIPILLRGKDEDIPPKIKEIQYRDFSNFQLVGRRLKEDNNFYNDLKEIF
jgi:TIR domain